MRLFSLVTVLVLIAFIGSINYFRYTTFVDYQHKIAATSTSSLSEQVSYFIQQQQRQVRLFAHTNIELINQYIKEPDNQNIEKSLNAILTNRFPDYFAFAISDEKGNLYAEDFDNKIIGMCKTDIKNFTITNVNQPRIHPNAEMYHFDIMSDIDIGQVIFVSFNASILGSMVKQTQAKGHQLIIGIEGADTLIEVTDLGARNKQYRVNYNLTTEEKARVLHSQKIPFTKWTAIDLYEEDYFNDKILEIILQSFAILIIFFLILVLAKLPFFKLF